MTRNPLDPASKAEQAPGYRPRRAERLAVEGKTRLTPNDLYTVEIRVEDVSSAGFMAHCAEPVRIGSHVSLEIPGIGAVDAQVRWQIGARMGGMFLDPISLARCQWTAVKSKAA